MPDVKFSNQYPYTDFHELNLDWVIKEVKYWSTKVGKTIQSITLTGTVGLVDTYTINYSDGTTSTFDVTNGNGIASVAKTGTAGLVDTYTITFQDGSTTTFTVTNGAAAVDPTLSLPDYAADAKVTGDEINEIRTIDNLFYLSSNQSLNHMNVGTNADGTIYARMDAGYSQITVNTRFDIFTIPAGTYTVSMEKVSGTGTDSGMYLQIGSSVIIRLSNPDPVTFTVTTPDILKLSFAKNNGYSYDSVKIMLNVGNIALPFIPHKYTAKDDIARALGIDNSADIDQLETETETLDVSVDAIADNIGMTVGSETTITAHESGKYVYSGTLAIASSGAFSYSEAVQVKKGDIILAKLSAQTGVVEAIAYCNASLTQFAHGVTGVDPVDGAPSDYRLVSDRDGYVCFSYVTAQNHDYRIITFDDSDKAPWDILPAFDNITCIGDSLTAGVVYTASGNVWRLAYVPYPKVLERKTGASCSILATGGYSASDAWTAYESSIVSKTNQLTIIYLGTNDGLTDTMATDMVGNDYTLWANTNTGCYGKLIAKSLNEGSRVLLVKIYVTDGDLDTTNSVIEQMATRFSVAVIDNRYLADEKYHSYPDGSGVNGVHYNDLGYSVFAEQLMQNAARMNDTMMKRIIPE